MRGSPLLRALLVFLGLALMAWPLHRLLQADERAHNPAQGTAPPPEPHSGAAVQKRIHLQIDFTTPPARLRLLALGQEVWSEVSPAPHLEHDLLLAYPKEGIELQLELDWPLETRAAAHLVLTDPDGLDHEKNVWSRGPTSEVLTFP